jgi:energy-coupling factor transporter transmembrane protein EcfT
MIRKSTFVCNTFYYITTALLIKLYMCVRVSNLPLFFYLNWICVSTVWYFLFFIFCCNLHFATSLRDMTWVYCHDMSSLDSINLQHLQHTYTLGQKKNMPVSCFHDKFVFKFFVFWPERKKMQGHVQANRTMNSSTKGMCLEILRVGMDISRLWMNNTVTDY